MANGFDFYEGAKTDSETTAQVTVRKGGQLVLTQAAVVLPGQLRDRRSAKGPKMTRTQRQPRIVNYAYRNHV